MALVTGYITRLGVVGATEPAGRVTLVDPDDPSTVVANVNVTSGPKLDVAMLARQIGQIVEIDVLATTNPMVADKIRLV